VAREWYTSSFHRFLTRHNRVPILDISCGMVRQFMEFRAIAFNLNSPITGLYNCLSDRDRSRLAVKVWILFFWFLIGRDNHVTIF
jgi:hypothetical protein